MNIGTFVGLVLLTGVIFICFGLISDGMDTQLIETGIVNTTPISEEYRTNFNQTDTIRDDFKDIETGLSGLGNESNWWSDLGDFVGAVPIVVIDFPVVVLKTLYNSIINLKIILNTLGIPIEIAVIASLGLIIWIIFKLINFWKSGKEI